MMKISQELQMLFLVPCPLLRRQRLNVSNQSFQVELIHIVVTNNE